MADKKVELNEENLEDVVGSRKVVTRYVGTGGYVNSGSFERTQRRAGGKKTSGGGGVDGGGDFGEPDPVADTKIPTATNISNRISGTDNKSLQQGGNNTIGDNSINTM